jgi:hypothetical protein
MSDEQGTTSLRDQLAANLEAVETETVTPAPEQPVTTAPAEVVPENETAEQKAGRTAGRARDEHGRLLPGPAVKPQQAPVERPQRPSSWKKEMWEHWDKLDPNVAKYLHEREQQFASGVSTYKNEWEAVKPLQEAIAPFLPRLQQHGIDPGQWIKNLGTAHEVLALGTPQDKVSKFQQLLGEYGVPAQLAVQGPDGQWQLLGAPQRQQQAPDVNHLVNTAVQRALQEQFTQQEIQRFSQDKEKHPHYDTVRGTMAGLLQSGLAENLEDAYQAALRHPRHSDIYDAQQQQQRDTEEQRKREEAAARVRQARGNAFSTKGSTPGAETGNAAKGLRSQLESAYDEHAGGRV